MITFKLSLRGTELIPLANFVNKLVGITEHSIESIDYRDFYNIRHFCKILFDKNYSMQNRNAKKITLRININIFDSLLHLYNLNNIELEKPENLYSMVIYRDALFEMDKQRVNLIEYKKLQ